MEILLSSNIVEVNEKEKAVISCVTNKEIAKRDLVWSTKSEKIFETLKFRTESKPDGLNHQLTISDCSLDDAGVFKIKVKDTEVTVNLIVKGIYRILCLESLFFNIFFQFLELPVSFEKPLKDQTVMENSTGTFECTLSKPNQKVKWFMNGIEISDADNVYKSAARCNHTLTLSKIPKDFTGVLTCKVFDKEDEVATSSCNITVKEMPTDIIKPLSNVKCTEKETVTFELALNKVIPSEQIKWFKNGVELTNLENIEIKSDGVKQFLIIKKSAVDDSGNYSVKIDELTSSAICKVKGIINAII